jgi:hypothetical protein
LAGNFDPQETSAPTPLTSVIRPDCSLTQGLVVKLSLLYLPGSLFSPQ